MTSFLSPSAMQNSGMMADPGHGSLDIFSKKLITIMATLGVASSSRPIRACMHAVKFKVRV